MKFERLVVKEVRKAGGHLGGRAAGGGSAWSIRSLRNEQGFSAGVSGGFGGGAARSIIPPCRVFSGVVTVRLSGGYDVGKC